MNRHQVLTGAVNPGDSCFAVGYVDGVPFTAYASGCDIVILASDFQRTQIIPGEKHGNIQVGCIDCSSENGKIAASYANQVYIFEPTPVAQRKNSNHKLEYQWQQTGSFKIDSLVSNLSWNQDGTRLLTGSNAIQLWACEKVVTIEVSEAGEETNKPSDEPIPGYVWQCVWQCKTATAIYHLKFSSDGQFFASAGKADRLVKIWYQNRHPNLGLGPSDKGTQRDSNKTESYSFIYIAHPRAVTGFSWRKTSKYMLSGAVANVLVTSCRDNICRLWCETLLPDTTASKGSSKYSQHVENSKEHASSKRPQFSLSIKPRKKRKQVEHAIPLPSQKKEHELHRYYHGKVHRNGLGGNPLHFHIAATINPNTDIPLLPAIGTMTKGNAPNFVVNWLNNKELQFTLAAETLLQTGKETRPHDFTLGGPPDEEQGVTAEDSRTSDQEAQSDEDDIPTVKINADSSNQDFTKDANIDSPSIQTPSRPDNLNTSPFSPNSSPVPTLTRGGVQAQRTVEKKFQELIKEWHCNADMLYSIHPIDGSFLLWLVDWMDEHIPGVHRQPQVSFSCRIPHAFPTFDATTLCNNLVLYRSNLTMDPRASRRLLDPMSPAEAPGMTPSYSFAKYLSQVPSGVDIFAFTPKVSMLSKHTNGSLNQWEISFQEGSKFQTVLNVNHMGRACGHRFSLNHLACHPILPLLLTTSHHNIPKVEVDFDVATSRSRRTSMISRRASIVKRASMAMEAGTSSLPQGPGAINLFGKNVLSESEHSRLMTLYNSTVEGSTQDFNEKDEIILPDELMEQVNAELNWPDMSAPTGLCSELILWRVFNVGPLGKGGGVMELARINSPFVSAFSHIAWMPSLLPSSCLGPISNSPSACFIASDGYSLRVFQAVIDARSLLNEITPSSNQLEGYLSSSSPVTAFLLQNANGEEEAKGQRSPQVISLQSTSRPGCVIELDPLTNAKQNWKNVQLMHVYQQQFISGPDGKVKHSRSSHRMGSTSSSPLHTNLFEERFFLVVVERKSGGESVVHMWYIRLERELSKGGSVQCDGLVSDEESDLEDDIPDDSSSNLSEGSASAQYDSKKNTERVSSKIKTFSHKVCSQKLTLPSGVEVISATPAAGHLSSSSIYPACVAPYLFTTACSDGKLRFWMCNMSPRDGSQASFDEEEELHQDIDPSQQDSFTRASYKWEEWKLVVQSEPDSALSVGGLPVALSCAYNGRIACIYRMTAPRSMLDPEPVSLKLGIYECESTGGSEWTIEEVIDLGVLDLKAWMHQGDDEVLESDVVSYKTMKRSSKVNDFLNISGSPSSSCGSPPSPESLPAAVAQRKRSIHRGRQSHSDDWSLPVQLSWVSKEDGTHILTVGMGSKVVVFAPVSTELFEAGSDGIPEDRIMPPTGLQRGATMGETTGAKWMPLRTVKLTSVDGIAPHSKMLSWVRAGILVIGLQNEMQVYCQWREENWRSRRRKYRRPVPSVAETVVSQKSVSSSLSVNLQTVPMSRTDREKSYNDMSELLRGSGMMSSNQEQEEDRDDVTQDFGLFEISYSACPVLPQYHPKQLMGLMSSGKIRRVKAILVHLVNCIAGEEAVKRSLLAGVSKQGDKIVDDEEEQFRRSLKTLSVAHSPVEPSVLDDSGPKLDYIELVSVPPLPLYHLTSADTPVTVATAPTVTRASRTMSILGPPDELEMVDTQDYSQLFSTSADGFPSSLEPSGELRSPQDGAASVSSKLKDPAYFTVGQAQLLTNYLTHMHLPGLSSLDQMHLLALADTIASTKTEITSHSGGSAGTVIGREGAGYANVGNSDSSHAGETLDECGLRFLLAMRFHVCLTKSLPLHQQVQWKHQGLATCHFAWAFHSEAEEELLSLIPGMQKGTPTWAELRSVGVGWWVRNNTTLKRCIEKVAKSQFQANRNPLDSSLFYLAMKKKAVLWGLFRSIQDQRMTNFFRNDFNKDRWRKAALKNAFQLLGKQRFEHAAAFFLLAGSLKDAIEVCTNNLKDIQLAMVVARLYEDEEMPQTQKDILGLKILAQDEKGNPMEGNYPHPDPFLRSIAHWMLRDYPSALKTLLQSPAKEGNNPKSNLSNGEKAEGSSEIETKSERANPEVFNFYNYLRTHPLFVRRQLADANKASQGMGLLIVGASGGGFGQMAGQDERLVKDEITPEERRLFFTTAHTHLSAGCPLLALDVLSKLPKVRTKPKVDENKLAESKAEESPPSSSVISTGTFKEGFLSSSYTDSSSKDSGMGMDWGAPVSQMTNGHKNDSGLDMDWGSSFAGRFEEEELKLDWGNDNDDDEEEEEEKTEKGEGSTANPADETLVNGADDSTIGSRQESTVGEEEEDNSIDIMAQQLKFICCLKIMMEELRTLATGFEVDGGQLRYQLYIWLEQQVETLRQLCHYGSPVTIKSIAEDEGADEQDGADGDERQSTLYEQLQAKRLDLEEKRQRAVRRKRWLRDNHHLLRTLVSYTMLYGASGGGLASVAMELVLLVQELQQERIVQQLSSPLPLPTTLPLMSASIANCKTVVTDPILYLRLHIHSILRTILDFSAPPSPNHHSPIISVVHALSAALSACVYQSLCDSDSFSASIGKAKITGMDAYTPRASNNVMFRVGQLVSAGRKRSRHPSHDQHNLSITSPPGKWPGVATYQALLASERDDDIPIPNIQLCEGLLAVYMSLLLHALANNNANELFRLIGHDLNDKTWASVFGGGAKVVAQSKLLASHSSSSGDETLAKQRDRLALRLMGKARMGRNSSAAPDDKPVLREVFVPPETSIRDYFLVKPYIPPNQTGIDYDSSASDSSDDEDLDYMDHDDDYDDTGPYRRKRPGVPLPGETEHSDNNSYSWCLMRYAVVKLVLHKLQAFLPLVGIELAELPVASPIMHSVLKLLEQWQQACVRKLDLFARPPPDFISETSGSSMTGLSGPAILRYKGLLDPSNTPFRSDSKSTLPAKRLWNFLVRQESIQELFIKYIFKKGSVMDGINDPMRSPSRSMGSLPQAASQARLIHKEQEKISAFCFNQADWKNISMNGEFQSNPSTVVVSTHRGLLELDISLMLSPDNSYIMEEGIDDSNNGRNTPTEDDFLMVQPASIPQSRHSLNKSTSAPFIQMPPGGFNPAFPSDSTPAQTGRSTHVITHRPLYHIRQLAAHPNLPYYLSGSNDGSVHMWEWGHSQKLYTHRAPGQFPKVTQIDFNDQGNKFGVADDGGQLSLWQVGMNSPAATKPFWSMACHNKTAYDFAFLGSSSLLVTSGLSTDSKNVCLWDTLLPFRKCMIHGFSCHEGGTPSVLYCPRQQTIIAGSKKGEVSIFDVRQRKLRHTFQAHESSIRSLCVDPMEEFFVTGSAEGNIKVWSLSVHSLLHYFPGQHTRGTFFRQSGNGVVQLAFVPPNNLYSCGADGTMKWRVLDTLSNPPSATAAMGAPSLA
ncbi:dmX-like protein 2 [Diadema antillarum]|uniref:dmX-like protein 2 n=1 Tax=Diadema antillarum TaxID=105358 RepID=UPI003A8B54EC